MEYVQMTLDDWAQIKQKLKQELLGELNRASSESDTHSDRLMTRNSMRETDIKAWQNSPRRNMDWNHPLQAVL